MLKDADVQHGCATRLTPKAEWVIVRTPLSYCRIAHDYKEVQSSQLKGNPAPRMYRNDTLFVHVCDKNM